MRKTIKCVVCAMNANGQPDLYFVRVNGTQEQFDEGQHYEAAENDADAQDYEPKLVYDETDPYSFELLSICPNWRRTTLINLQ